MRGGHLALSLSQPSPNRVLEGPDTAETFMESTITGNVLSRENLVKLFDVGNVIKCLKKCSSSG